jgi:glycosidase
MRSTFTFLTLLVFISSFAQKKQLVNFTHVEPSFWWVGMKNASLQILFHSKTESIADFQATINYEGVTLRETKRVENPHYLFLTLEISPSARPGKVSVNFSAGKKTFTYQYELRGKSTEANRIQGFTAADVLYLIMPDRFSNGDLSNDSIPNFYQGTHRNIPNGRHGGDIKGIADHLDYIKELGVTTLWLNPVLENNQKRESYHGYAITDLYKVDRRFGTNDDYIAFINKCHQMGLKLIQDMVMNHIGNEHWLVHDLPEKNWIHQFPEFTRSNYRGTVISDPYKSKQDEMLMSNGWFDTTMPDVDQTNPLFATYLIQNTLWWIEYAGLDGIRMDTYPYPDKDFMARWIQEVKNEYPKFNIVGEAWLNNIPNIAYWQKGMTNKDGYESTLPSVTDFPFCFAVPQALNEAGGWDNGMARLYNLLCQDFIYPNANNNVTFVDNHDMTRFFLLCNRDVKKFKMGLTFLLTTRGIPELYYGTELLMDGDGGYHPNIRKDFPGGWKGDGINAFTKEGRTAEQNDAFDFLKTLLNWRKNSPVISEGKLTHYIPEDNIYVYFRYNADKRVMVVMNGNNTEKTLNTKRFAENLQGVTAGREVISNKKISDIANIQVPALTALVIVLE